MFKALFTPFDRDHHELSGALGRYALPLLERIRHAVSLEDLDALEVDGVDALVATVRVEPPLVETLFRPGTRTDGPTRRTLDRARGVPTTRHWVPFAVSGEQELLRRWPDQPEIDIDPVDVDWYDGDPMRRVEFSTSDELAYTDDNMPTWCLEGVEERDDGSMEWALYTHLDLTLEEEQAVADGELDLARLVAARRERIDPIVTAIATQIEQFFEVKLPTILAERLAEKRRVLTNRQAVTTALTLPDQWRAKKPQVIVSGADDPNESPGRDRNTVDGKHGSPVPVEPSVGRGSDLDENESSKPVSVNSRARLEPVSFEDVLRTIRTWASAIERYPGAFNLLGEERISDLLAATLNATVPEADREVFSQNGRSDIFIKANVLDADMGPAKVFICEAKKATSKKAIREALDPQLFGYLNVHDTSAIVLVLLHQKEFHRARRTYLAVLESVDGYRGTDGEYIEGWPILTFRHEGRNVQVCAAFVHVRPPHKPRAMK